jgi:hypothetical protein
VKWFQSALLSAVRFDPAIPDGIFSSLISQVLSRTTQAGKLPAEQLIKTTADEERKYLNKPIHGFHVLTSPSISGKSSLVEGQSSKTPQCTLSRLPSLINRQYRHRPHDLIRGASYG